MNMNIMPAFRYRLAEAVKGALIFFGIMVLSMTGVTSVIFYIGIQGGHISGNFSGFGIAAAIMMFVIGICTIREDLRLMLQNGMGRRTVFVTELLTIVTVALLLAALGELLVIAGQAVTSGWSNYYITDIFQIVYFSEMGAHLTLTAHIASMACFFALYVCANLAGMFFSLLFYRLNKAWTIIVAIGAPLLLIFGLPNLLFWRGNPSFLSTALTKLFAFSFSTPWTLLLTFAVCAVLIAVVNWLMLRRAPVKPAK